jgi:hypothetical protein
MTVHTLVAKAVEENGEQYSNTRYVTCDPEAPQPVELTLKRSGGTKVVDISGGAPRFPYIVDGQPVYYGVKFNYPEKVEDVKIFEGNQEMATTFNPATNRFEVVQQEGMTGYGDIYIDYDLKSKPYEEQTNEELYDSLPPEMKNEYHAEFGEPSYSEENGNLLSGFIKSKDNTAVAKVTLQLKPIENYPTPPPVPLGTPKIYDPSFSVTGKGETLKISMQGTVLVDANFRSSLKAMGVDVQALNIPSWVPANLLGISVETIGAGLGSILAQLYLTNDYLDKVNDLDALQRKVNSNSCLSFATDVFTNRIEELKNEVFALFLANSLLALSAGIGAVVLGPFAAIPALLIGVGTYFIGKNLDQKMNELTGDVEYVIDTNVDAGNCKRDQSEPESDSKSPSHGTDQNQPASDSPYAIPNRIYDPSGYVYEAVPSNRVEGVKATILHKIGSTWEPWDAEW